MSVVKKKLQNGAINWVIKDTDELHRNEKNGPAVIAESYLSASRRPLPNTGRG
jgi:hypothetical protein